MSNVLLGITTVSVPSLVPNVTITLSALSGGNIFSNILLCSKSVNDFIVVIIIFVSHIRV